MIGAFKMVPETVISIFSGICILTSLIDIWHKLFLLFLMPNPT